MAQASPDAPSSPPMPPVVSGFVLHSFLGRGSSGMVWRATQEGTLREVALKLLAPWHSHALAPLRFEREAEIAASLEHEAIARVFGAGECAAGPWLAMELVDGPPADVWVRETNPPLRQRVEFFRNVCAGLSHAHQRGVIHRDLKPGNVLVAPDNQPKIVDFGLARRESGSSLDVSLTREGDFFGTLGWMPPEQAAGRWSEVDALSDVFSLGAILFGLLTGQPPLDTSLPPESLLAAAQSGERRLAREVARSVPRDLEAIIARCLAAKKQDRYQSVAELDADVSRWLAGDPVLAPVNTPLYWLRKKVRRHWPSVALGTAAIAAAGGLAASYLAAKKRVEAERRAALEREAAQKQLTLHEAEALVTQLLMEMQPIFEQAGHPEWIDQALQRVEAFPWDKSGGTTIDARRFRGRAALVQGDQLAGRSNWGAALRAYNQAVENLKLLVEENPSVSLFREELIQARLGSSKALLKLGYHKEAYRAATRVLELSHPKGSATVPPALTSDVVEAITRLAEATVGLPERAMDALLLARQALGLISPHPPTSDVATTEAEWRALLCYHIAKLSLLHEDREKSRQAAAAAEAASRDLLTRTKEGELSERLLSLTLILIADGALMDNDAAGACRSVDEASRRLATSRIPKTQNSSPYEEAARAWERCAYHIIDRHGAPWAIECLDRALDLWMLIDRHVHTSESLAALTSLNLTNARWADLSRNAEATGRYAITTIRHSDLSGKDDKMRPVMALDAIDAALLLIKSGMPNRPGDAPSWRIVIENAMNWLKSSKHTLTPELQKRRASLEAEAQALLPP